ncbi:GDYXXLXY domain-containing protein [Azospirillum soli]|uniref:GDYXXLXY domain-containing protein n=1 Tax=Azospirillum soli TaxID=1304799 RepID=UPI001AE56999|nr:GDYXXLXY domain-containing protein [Azospirillum soli]MBP2314405.1 hypothetical protein [Azospirillum soli]
MTRRILTLALLILPTLLVAGWALRLAAERDSQPVLRVAIAGYDPRDLLRGHYLQFRLDLPVGDDMACACLHPNAADTLRPTAVAVQCTPPTTNCRHPITNPRQVYRYYAAQERALALQGELLGTPGGASVLVHFHGNGTVSFSDVAVEHR